MRTRDLVSMARSAICSLSGTPVEDFRRVSSVFVLGPYGPPRSKLLLTTLRDNLSSEFGYTAFLEEDIVLPVPTDIKFETLFPLCSEAVFVLTNEGIAKGWQLELGQLSRFPKRIGKAAVYYEEYETLQTTVKDFIVDKINHHGPIVQPDDIAATTRDISNLVNSYLARIV